MTTMDIDAGGHGAGAPSPPLGGEGRGEGASPRAAADAVFRRGSTITLGAADWLSLAAAPTFALMALLTAAFDGRPDVLCAALQGASPLSGMVPMYLLMSAFHVGPWLKLILVDPRSAHGSGDGIAQT